MLLFSGIKNWELLYRAVETKLKNNGNGCHDFDHTLRVIANTCALLKELPEANAETALLAALLHDIARPEEDNSCGTICHAELGAEIAARMLADAGISPDISEQVTAAVRTHRFRSDDPPQSLEAQVVYDADKLDSLGAVGIGRAFLFAGRTGARLHNTAEEALNSPAYSAEDTAYREYLVKLRYIPEKMFTPAGRSIAAGRLEYMEKFFSELESELH